MRGIVLEGDRAVFRSDLTEPTPQPGEILIDVVRAGVCETDLQLMKGYMGFAGILGHEFVGIARSGKFSGERVVGEINCNCRRCDYCEDGLGNHCPHRSVLGILQHDGAFADVIAVPEHNLLRVPDNLSDDQAVFTEPLAAAFQIPARVQLQAGQSVVVLGDGRLGNLCAQVARTRGCDVRVVGKHSAKLTVLNAIGIETVLLGDLVPDRNAHVVIDCTGSPTGLATAMQIVRPRGTIVLKTTVAADHSVSLAPIVIDEITVVGSRCGPFATALEALRDGSIEVDSMVTSRYPLSDGVNALHNATGPGTLKVLIDVRDS